MKYILFTLSVLLCLTACNNKTNEVSINDTQFLQSKIDSLEQRLENCYSPGFGEFMSNIQAHHSKLWFAGQNQNWELANFEVIEIKEALEDIQKFQSEREESKNIVMLNPAIDSISKAINQKNSVQFKSSFVILTNACNNCHRATNFGFNRVIVPQTSSFSNQDFRVEN